MALWRFQPGLQMKSGRYSTLKLSLVTFAERNLKSHPAQVDRHDSHGDQLWSLPEG